MVSGSQSKEKTEWGGGFNGRPPHKLTQTEQLESQCPIYMAMGMTYEQYWDGDCEMAKAYRKYNELMQEKENEKAWQYGVYVYEALASIMSFKKKYKYPEKPHPLNTSISKERIDKAQEANERKVVDYMMTFAEQWNKGFAAKQKAKEKNLINKNMKSTSIPK